MFRVKHKHDGMIYTVYHVHITARHDIHFIVYADRHWYEWDAEEFDAVD